MKEKITFNTEDSIHTVEVKTDTPSAAIDKPYLDTEKIRCDISGTTYYYYVINPNEVGNGIVKSYAEFSNSFAVALKEMEIENSEVSRVDFRMDSYGIDDHRKFEKLNRCLILILSRKYRNKNQYESINPATLEHLTTRIDNKYFQVENYNKSIQDPRGKVTNRTEFRLVNMLTGYRSKASKNCELSKLFMKKWRDILGDLINYYDDMTAQMNNILLTKYNDDMKYSHGGNNCLSYFITRYQDSIFSKKQLTDFLSSIGNPKPKDYMNKFLRRHEIEFVNSTTMGAYLDFILSSMGGYMGKNE